MPGYYRTARQSTTGRKGWRLRIGAYRVIYEVDDTQQRVTILAIGHRRDIDR